MERSEREKGIKFLKLSIHSFSKIKKEYEKLISFCEKNATEFIDNDLQELIMENSTLISAEVDKIEELIDLMERYKTQFQIQSIVERYGGDI